MFFEDTHSFQREEFKYRYSDNFTYPSHIHRAFEFHIQLEGETLFMVNGKEYVLSPGDAALSFPYQYHSIKQLSEGKQLGIFFSPDIVSDFYKTGIIPTENNMKFDFDPNTDLSNRFLRHAFAYYICGLFDKGRAYTSDDANNDILTSILTYTDDHFCEQHLLENISKKIGYNYTYISKLFKKKLGISFNQYVNLLKIQKSEILLAQTRKGVTEIALECGFNSLRSYNRKFSEAFAISPTEYRKYRKEKRGDV